MVMIMAKYVRLSPGGRVTWCRRAPGARAASVLFIKVLKVRGKIGFKKAACGHKGAYYIILYYLYMHKILHF